MNWLEFWEGFNNTKFNLEEFNRTLVIIGCFTMLIIMVLTPQHESEVIYTGIFTLLGYTVSRRNEQSK